jgi:hypothetical protein
MYPPIDQKQFESKIQACCRQAFPREITVPCDLTNFDLRAAETCAGGLASAIVKASTMESAARAGCTFVRDELRDPRGERAGILVRFYKTHRYGDLPPDIQRVAKRAYGAIAFSPPEPDMRCLVLLATVGDEPAWNDRRMSKNHQAIPLPSRHIVESAPMVAQLIRELGLDLAEIIQPAQGVVRELAGRTYGVFHVADALGSPYIPAQDFVQRHGVRSVIGFGGAVSSGDLAAMIVFSRVPIAIDVADRFRALALDVTESFARFLPQNTFDTTGQ